MFHAIVNRSRALCRAEDSLAFTTPGCPCKRAVSNAGSPPSRRSRYRPQGKLPSTSSKAPAVADGSARRSLLARMPRQCTPCVLRVRRRAYAPRHWLRRRWSVHYSALALQVAERSRNANEHVARAWCGNQHGVRARAFFSGFGCFNSPEHLDVRGLVLHWPSTAAQCGLGRDMCRAEAMFARTCRGTSAAFTDPCPCFCKRYLQTGCVKEYCILQLRLCAACDHRASGRGSCVTPLPSCVGPCVFRAPPHPACWWK